MKRIAFLVIAAMALPARAGNEAGGNWVRARFLARAYEAFSELCRYPEAGRAQSDEAMRRLEALIAGTRVVAVDEDSALVARLERDGRDTLLTRDGNTPIILLRKRAWDRLFAHHVDVYAEALIPYLTLDGMAHPTDTARAIDFSALATNGRFRLEPRDPGRGIPAIRLAGVLWKSVPVRARATEAARHCERLNDNPALARAASWSLPTSVQLAPGATARELRAYVAELPYKLPMSFRAWVRQAETGDFGAVDLFEDRALERVPEENGVLCVGAPK